MTQNRSDHAAVASQTLNGYPAKSDSADAAKGPRPLREVCREMRDKIEAFLAEKPVTSLLKDVQAQLRVSLKIVEEALENYPYVCSRRIASWHCALDANTLAIRSDQISISYNGGKDCMYAIHLSLRFKLRFSQTSMAFKCRRHFMWYAGTDICSQGLVLLIILLAALSRHYSPRPDNEKQNESDSTTFPEKFQAIYIIPPDHFPEIDEFVDSSGGEYHLEVARYMLPMKQGLELYLADRPNTKAIFVGTRRTDPHGENLKHFDPTDAGWPAFMRVHPVIDWHYGEAPFKRYRVG